MLGNFSHCARKTGPMVNGVTGHVQSKVLIRTYAFMSHVIELTLSTFSKCAIQVQVPKGVQRTFIGPAEDSLNSIVCNDVCENLNLSRSADPD